MKTSLLTTILILISISSFGQLDDNFCRLSCSGEIPSYFKQLLSDEIKQDKKELDKSGTKLSKKNALEFVAVTNYGIQKYIQSGKVLYGDPLTNYASEILEKLKKVSDEDINHVQIFTLKSTEVNAFAVHQGFIFITTGLWSHLENESQLANIIGHELQHIISKHSLEKFEFIQDQISFGQIGKNELSEQYKYARKAEFEADEAGFILAKKAGYNDSLLISCMSMLAISHRPIVEYEIDYTRFEDSYFKLPKDIKLIHKEKIKSRWDLNEENATHPDIKSRYERLISLSDSTKFEINYQENPRFLECRSLAQADLLNSFIVSGNYLDGLYHNIILLNKYPSNPFLKRTYAMMWYGQAAENNTEFGTRYSSDYRHTSGELERFYFMFFKLSKPALTTMAVREIWKLSTENPKDSFLINLRSKILLEFVSHDRNTLENFKTIAQIEEKEKQKRRIKNDMVAAIAHLLDNPLFLTELNSASRLLELLKKDIEVFSNERNIVNTDRKKGKILVAKPLYSKQDFRKNITKNLTENESSENKMVELAEGSINENNLSLDFFGNITDPDFQTKQYNEMAILYDYIQENIKHPGYDFLPFNSQNINQINGIDSVGSIGYISMQSVAFNKKFHGTAAFFSAISVFGFPTYLRWQLEPKQFSYLYSEIYDLKTHNTSLRFTRLCNTPLNVYLESAQVYNALNQFNSKQ